MASLTEEELGKLRVAHREGFEAGVRGGKEPNCPYQPDSAEIIFWDKGREDGTAFRLELATDE